MAYQDYTTNTNTSQDIYDEEFVTLINGLNESIKEYYKISKHNLKETNKFLDNFEKQWNSMENSLNFIVQKKSLSNIEEVLDSIKQSKNIVNQLQNNSVSTETNLNLFFEDAKILFKRMRLKRNENLMNLRRSNRSYPNKNRKLNQNISSSGLSESALKNSRNIYDNIVKINNIEKIIYYLNQLKDYNEIVGKFSMKAKFNYINLQKMIFNILNDSQNNIGLKDSLNYFKSEGSTYSMKINKTEPNDEIKNFELKNKYDKEIFNLKNKIKELEKNLNTNKTNYLDNNKINELKKKIQLELPELNSKENNNENNFENMVLNLIDMNKNINTELTNIKNELRKKNEQAKNYNLVNNKLKHELLRKENAIKEKENEINILSKDQNKSDESNPKFRNISHKANNQNNELSHNSIIELRKELKNLYKENNTLRNELNDLKINMIGGETHLNTQSNVEHFSNNNNDINTIKKELELHKQNSILMKKKYEKEINLINKKCEDLSKKLTSKTDEIISLQRENINLKSGINDQSHNMYNNSSKYLIMKDAQNNLVQGQKLQNNSANLNEIIILREQNKKLKNMINSYELNKNNMKNNLFKLTQEKKELNKQLMLQRQQLQNKEGNPNYNQTIINLQKELEQLRKLIEENNYKSIEYEQQINNLQNVLNEKDELINQYKNSIQNLKNNNINKVNNTNDTIQLQKLNNTLMNQLKIKNKEIENLKIKSSNNNNIDNDNQTIIELNKIISDNKKEIQALNKKIMSLKMGKSETSRSEQINKYQKEINELNNAFLKANSIIEEKDIMIKKLKENACFNNNEKDLQIKINELNNYIKQLEQENKNLTDEIMKTNQQSNNNVQTDETINMLNLKITNLEEENEYYKNKAEELKEQIKNNQKIEHKNTFNDNILEMIYDDKNNDELNLIKKEKQNLENNIEQLKKEISNLNQLNEKLKQDINQEKNKNSELLKENSNVKKKNEQLLEKLKPNNNDNNNLIDDKNNDIENQLKKKEDELEAINAFVFKIQKDLEKAKEENELYKPKLNTLQKENISLKKQLERLSITMPKELNALQTQLEEAKKTQILAGNSNNNINNSNQKNLSLTDRNKKKNKSKNKTTENNDINYEAYNNLLNKYNEANKEINELKSKNKELLFQLEEKEVKSAYSGYRTEDVNISNYEEEFDLRKMANGAREKNRSEDINIDYPGMTGIKERLKELEFRYKNLVEQVKILIGNITFNQKIKPQVTQICQLLGYSPKTTGRILTSKEKKKILGI